MDLIEKEKEQLNYIKQIIKNKEMQIKQIDI